MTGSQRRLVAVMSVRLENGEILYRRGLRLYDVKGNCWRIDWRAKKAYKVRGNINEIEKAN